jgi:hypothetical protein
MDWPPRGAPRDGALFLARFVTGGSTAMARAGIRTGSRSFGLCLRRSPTLVKLAVQAGTAPDGASASQSVLRDELLGLVHDLADLSWREARRALDELDATTRSDDGAPVSEPVRRARVKP